MCFPLDTRKQKLKVADVRDESFRAFPGLINKCVSDRGKSRKAFKKGGCKKLRATLRYSNFFLFFVSSTPHLLHKPFSPVASGAFGTLSDHGDADFPLLCLRLTWAQRL